MSVHEQTTDHVHEATIWHSFDEKVWGGGTVVIHLRVNVPSCLGTFPDA